MRTNTPFYNQKQGELCSIQSTIHSYYKYKIIFNIPLVIQYYTFSFVSYHYDSYCINVYFLYTLLEIVTE